jgi:hypothetical protein
MASLKLNKSVLYNRSRKQLGLEMEEMASLSCMKKVNLG